ncbi:putative thaumatin [Lupinus albus]|uniref:Putative thaumatin n=1 Tax=Lupinus albus TaxID=3870 RepID=A0A6A4NMI6_LUPAL|nr:putative thaumatin [Lupinus albus]
MMNLIHAGTYSISVTLKNNCPYTIWPGTLSGGGTPQLSSTGFELASQASNTIEVPSTWSGRFWGRTQCSTDTNGKFKCSSGDCASGQISCNGAGGIPPVSLVEITLSGADGKDFYDVSLVDGFNVPVSIKPLAGSCHITSCPNDVNKICPQDLALKGSDGSVIACKSACLALNQPQYCCSGSFNTPDKCPPTNYSKIFKDQCPQAYSYAFDDKSSIFTCPSGGNYEITFCP